MLVYFPTRFLMRSWFSGSPQESDEVPILSGLPENHEFGLGGGHAMGFEQEVLKILTPAI